MIKISHPIPFVQSFLENLGSMGKKPPATCIEDLPVITAKEISSLLAYSLPLEKPVAVKKDAKLKDRVYAFSVTWIGERKIMADLAWFNGKEERRQTVILQASPSNLRKGKCWLFINEANDSIVEDENKEKGSRKLYRYQDEYVEKQALPETILYRAQTLAKSKREAYAIGKRTAKLKQCKKDLEESKIREKYNGRPTRSYTRARAFMWNEMTDKLRSHELFIEELEKMNSKFGKLLEDRAKRAEPEIISRYPKGFKPD